MYLLELPQEKTSFGIIGSLTEKGKPAFLSIILGIWHLTKIFEADYGQKNWRHSRYMAVSLTLNSDHNGINFAIMFLNYIRLG